MLTFKQHPHTSNSILSKAYLNGKMKNTAARVFAEEMQQTVNLAKLSCSWRALSVGRRLMLIATASLCILRLVRMWLC